MSDIAQWSEAERDEFSHQLEKLIHGPNPTRKIGFVLTVFPVEESTRAHVLSNCDNKMVTTVLYTILKGLTQQGGALPYVG